MYFLHECYTPIKNNDKVGTGSSHSKNAGLQPGDSGKSFGVGTTSKFGGCLKDREVKGNG